MFKTYNTLDLDNLDNRLAALHRAALLSEEPNVKNSDEEVALYESKTRLLRPKSKYCVHGFIPDYCARCKFGELVH